MDLKAILEMELAELANGLGVGMTKRTYLCSAITIFMYLKLFFVNSVQLHKIEMPRCAKHS